MYDDLTVWENLRFYGGVYGITTARVCRIRSAHVGSTGHEDQLTVPTVHRLAPAPGVGHRASSTGQDCSSSTSRPRGSIPNARRAFWDLIYELARQGVT